MYMKRIVTMGTFSWRKYMIELFNEYKDSIICVCALHILSGPPMIGGGGVQERGYTTIFFMGVELGPISSV